MSQRALQPRHSVACTGWPAPPARTRCGLGILFALAGFALALAGCGSAGPAIVPVTGKVTLDNAPLAEGVVNFASESGYVSSAPLDSSGRFVLGSQYGRGIPLGTYRVTVLPPATAVSKASMEGAAPAAATKIPEKYQNADTSGLSATVDRESGELSFELYSATNVAR